MCEHSLHCRGVLGAAPTHAQPLLLHTPALSRARACPPSVHNCRAARRPALLCTPASKPYPPTYIPSRPAAAGGASPCCTYRRDAGIPNPSCLLSPVDLYDLAHVIHAFDVPPWESYATCAHPLPAYTKPDIAELMPKVVGYLSYLGYTNVANLTVPSPDKTATAPWATTSAPRTTPTCSFCSTT